MIESVKLQNFRSFQEVSIPDCRLINVVVGDNGSGKTALLEAIFLAAGASPELSLRTRQWRGAERGELSGSREEMFFEIWSDLFHQFTTSKPVLISLGGSREQRRSLTITLTRDGQQRPVVRQGRQKVVDIISEEASLRFRYRVGDQSFTVSAQLTDNKIGFDSAPQKHMKAAFFASNQTYSMREAVSRFSKLSQNFLEEKFISDFAILFPVIKDISIEIDSGSATLAANVDGLNRRIPVSLASGGMSKLIAILLTIPSMQDGAIIIDEIENGIYYDRLPLVWNSLLNMAKIYNCQLFISTHSRQNLTFGARV